ncbi:MAG TPA: hypothetical protein VFA74_01500 [Terriglobales bacterium]|nr:hypothetical protein [Terriglobales bacterium]
MIRSGTLRRDPVPQLYILPGGKELNEYSSGSATAAPLRPFGPLWIRTGTWEYGAGGCGLFRIRLSQLFSI